MPECDNPLWPCAMTGAAACLAGFDGMSVVIHGSSGCYYYPTTLLHAPLHGTFILENEVIFGSEDRLREVIGGLAGNGNRIAVITTCVPAILGEDIQALLAEHDVLLVDSPGFAGDAEAGYTKALSLLLPRTDAATEGVNIDGICLLDPFYKGNLQEIRRLLAMASIPVATVFCRDSLPKIDTAAACTIGTNGDYPAHVGEFLGGTLGPGTLRATFERLGNTFEGANIDPVLRDLSHQEEEIVRICDKYLRRFDPPSVVIFSGASYAEFAAQALVQYLDADIRFIAFRNTGGTSRFPGGMVRGLNEARSCIGQHDPDLVIGSSFERSITGRRAFLGMTPPLRGSVRLCPVPLAGINGTLFFIEQVLNACMDNSHSES
ncbi:MULTISPECIES: nitrogenase component 1 [unclassified Methanoregula]|uniref:nitrogenase component 1 n=1 Tax=unclassified Methanoregula TaxID=2649730 RepID=UPI0009C98AC9|nr:MULTISPECIES: nitrogenase component 1 [unclassified Methanoregula]OPX64923.1 MAG: Nitrogenase component 1 type Oxidoreductase [Methanoregula sp. PtaB.Bin085]OPY32975.1 MAG: Nitrogenase component 1 type Oxidoreductase [Methanoregula sp. PtaU1.Bin006]